jgi:hypothetical protein
VDVPGTAGRVEAGGFVDGLAVVESEHDSRRQRPQALGELRLDADITPRLRGHLALRSRIGGPFEGGHPGMLNLVHEFQNRSPYLEWSEAFGDLHLERADVRVGVQKVAWGKLDGIPPTDLIDPRDYHDPFVRDLEEGKIGVPAILGTYYLPDVPPVDLRGLRATFVWVPIAVPSRLALLEERWFPGSTAPVRRVVLPRARTEQAIERAFGVDVVLDRAPVIPVDFRTLNHRPPKQLDAGAIGFRLGGSWREMDWDVYHYTGPEPGPNADLLTTLFLLAPPAVDPVTHVVDLRLRAQSVLRQAHDTIHMTGGDWSAAFGGATVRGEIAFFDDRPYLRVARDRISPEALSQLPLRRLARQLLAHGHVFVPLGDLFVDRNSVEWGIGADYLVHGFLPLLQVSQVALLESAPRLIINDPETRLVANLRKRFAQDRAEFEMRAVYTAERGAWLVFPRVSYQLRDDLRVRLGYLALGGTRNSLIGQYGQNDELVLQARYSF